MTWTLEQEKLWIDAGFSPVFDSDAKVTGFQKVLDAETGLLVSYDLSSRGIGHKITWQRKITKD